MKPPQRSRRVKIFHDDTKLPEDDAVEKKRSETAKKRRHDALEPIPLESLPQPVHQVLDDPMPIYTPPFRVEYESFEFNDEEQTPFDLFLTFCTLQVLDWIVENTNSTASNWVPDNPLQHFRPWRNLTRHELLRFIGLLFYMGRHIEISRHLYWQVSTHNLGRHMGRDRFDQIDRFFSLRCKILHPFRPGIDTWWWKLNPVAHWVRLACQSTVKPSSWVTVDEIMIKFSGKSEHIVKMKGKPISEGFKIWGFGYDGYVEDWLFHSLKEGPEGIAKKKHLVIHQVVPLVAVPLPPTMQVVYRLLESFICRHPQQNFLAIIDNLFLNTELAHSLMRLGVAVLGTTRKNAEGTPQLLLEAKNARQGLVWNSMLSRQVGWTLCFCWQDNNAVLGMTTAFSVHLEEDRIERKRKRPKLTSTNAAVVRPIFGDQVIKKLLIPVAIDTYNRGMNGIDTANQLRKNFTCYRPRNCKWWRPIWYWLLDTCKTNAYLIWKKSQSGYHHHEHEVFYNRLIEQLLSIPLESEMPPVNFLRPQHTLIQLEKRTYCAWGLKFPGGCIANGASTRKFGEEVVNGVRATPRPRQVLTGCKECGRALCTHLKCWDHWHAQKAT